MIRGAFWGCFPGLPSAPLGPGLTYRAPREARGSPTAANRSLQGAPFGTPFALELARDLDLEARLRAGSRAGRLSFSATDHGVDRSRAAARGARPAGFGLEPLGGRSRPGHGRKWIH